MAILDKVESKKDNTWMIRVATNELHDEDILHLNKCVNKKGYFYFQEAPFTEIFVPEVKLSYQIKDETGEIAFGYSDNLEFIGTEYTYLYDKLVTNGGVDSTVELKFVDECCSPPLVYTFNIKRENIEWCLF